MLLFIILFQVSFSDLYELLLHFQINIFIIVFVPIESWGDVDDSQYKCIGARKKPHHIALGKQLFIVICCGQGIKQTVGKLNHLNSKLKLVLLRASKDWELMYLSLRQAGIPVFFCEPWNHLLVLLYCVDSKTKVDWDDVNYQGFGTTATTMITIINKTITTSIPIIKRKLNN